MLGSVPRIGENETAGGASFSPEKFTQQVELTLVQQIESNHPPAKWRLILAKALLGTIHEPQNFRSEPDFLQCWILQNSACFQSWKIAHFTSPKLRRSASSNLGALL